MEAVRKGKVEPDAEPAVVMKGPATAAIDGRRAFGQVAGRAAMKLAVRKARQGGIAAVTARNSYPTGRLGAYSQEAASEGRARDQRARRAG